MASSVIQRLNKNNPHLLKKTNSDYQILFGRDPFVPSPTIEQSSDVNCGALSNELEFLRTQVNEVINSFNIENAHTDLLEELVLLLVDFKRTFDEDDESLLLRSKAYLQRGGNLRWHTKWAYIDAFEYFFPSSIIIIEENFIYTNLILNESFESGFTDWTETETGSSVIIVDNVPFVGIASAGFQIDSSNSLASLSQTVASVAVGKQKFNFWYKDDGLCPSATVIQVSITRSSDGYYYNPVTASWQSGAVYFDVAKATDWTYFVAYFETDGVYDLTFTVKNGGSAGTAYNFWIDRVRFGTYPEYDAFNVLIISTDSGSGSTLFLSDDTVVDWAYSNLFLDQGFFGGAGGGLGTDFYTLFLEKMKTAGIAAYVEFGSRT